MKPTEATDIVIIDETESCPYLEGKIARMPLRMPLGKITLEQADLRLAEGNRRTGEFIYQTNCPDCNACEPIRLDCLDFKFSRNQRRSVNKRLPQPKHPINWLPYRSKVFLPIWVKFCCISILAKIKRSHPAMPRLTLNIALIAISVRATGILKALRSPNPCKIGSDLNPATGQRLAAVRSNVV